jgi:predicted amidohydrolase
VKNELKIVGIQADLVWQNSKQNIAFFEQQIDQLEAAIDLIVLPEMYTTGFTMHPEEVAEQMDGSTIAWMQKVAAKKQAAICGSLVISEPMEAAYDSNNGNAVPVGNYYNRFIFVHPSGKLQTYDKRHSFSLAGEDKVYTAGNQKTCIEYKGWKICPFICYDLRFPVWSRNDDNYDLLIYVANWPITRITAWESLLKARAIENMSYVIGVNRTGTDGNNYAYSGNSLILNYFGEILSDLEKDRVGIVSATIDKEQQELKRAKLGFLRDMDAFKILI